MNRGRCKIEVPEGEAKELDLAVLKRFYLNEYHYFYHYYFNDGK